MSIQNRTKEQLHDNIRQLELEITELKRDEEKHKDIAEALYQQYELYADLANALPSGIYRLRVFHEESLIEKKWATSEDAPYVLDFVNNRFCEILHLDRSIIELNPGIVNDLIFEEDKADFARVNVEANLYVTPFTWEGRLMINDDLIWIHFESIPRVLDNKDIIWTGTLNDISAHKNAEMEIKLKNRELQKLNAEKDKFFSIIAHDLKSPFNSIIGFSQHLVDLVNEKEYEQISEFAGIINKSSVRAMALLENLMEWAQSQSGRMEFKPSYFDLVAFLNETTLLFVDIAKHKSITINKDLPLYAPVLADKAMISAVFRNLISNAIKFTNQGGAVNISAVEKQNEILFSIMDTGVGIPENSIDKLFRIDQGYSTASTEREKGTGLGLILCKEFIEKHNGTIWVESIEGAGSTFNFTLPYHAES